jgi:ribonuclease HI
MSLKEKSMVIKSGLFTDTNRCNMNSFALFTDVSLNPTIKLGVGAYLVVPTSFLDVAPDRIVRSEVAERLRTRRFEGTSSTKLEVQTVLWALEHYRKECKVSGPGKLYVYSDSQCVAGLLRRRPGLEANSFRSNGTNRLLKNAALYRNFYKFYDELKCEVVKLVGHSRLCSHDTVHRIFSLVDREARKALKRWMREVEGDSIKSHTHITKKKGTPL